MKKKVISLLLCIVLVLSVLPIVSFNVLGTEDTGTSDTDPLEKITVADNLIYSDSSDFDDDDTVADSAWVKVAGSLSASIGTEGSNNYLLMTDFANKYSSYGIDLSDYITMADSYFITFNYKAKGQNTNNPFTATIRSDKQYSFIENTGSNYYSNGVLADAGYDNVWHTITYKFDVTQDDIDALGTSGYWNFCLHQIDTNVTEIAIDNFMVRGTNLMPAVKSTYDNATYVSQTGWEKAYGGSTLTLGLGTESGNKYFYFTKSDRENANNAWYSAGINIAPYIKKADTYTISFKYRSYSDAEYTGSPMTFALRCNTHCSFNDGTGTYTSVGGFNETVDGQWNTFTCRITVTNEDITNNKVYWTVCFHGIKTAITRIDVDDLKVVGSTSNFSAVKCAQTWVANEAVFISTNTYDDPYNDVTLDLILTNGTTTYTIPCFWDGGDIWRGRFACPTAGTWTYTTECSDTTNAGLHGQTSTLTCTTYSGDLDIYKKGFVKTVSGTRYFKYNNGEAFFYLGDTHWSLGTESVSMVRTIAEQRKAQGYTVIQSEPIGATFNFLDGITNADMSGFVSYDEKFQIIAENGLVHANSEFFFPSSMWQFVKNNGGWSTTDIVGYTSESDGSIAVYDMTDSAKKALETASRYWVARYGAYPVMWTLGQEVDNDFYWERDEHDEWNYVNNPYLYVAECIAKYDVYSHPLTGHMEGVSRTNLTGVTSSLTDSDQSKASAFKDCTAHTWYAAQWSQNYNKQINFLYAKDFWNNNTENKPVVNYEGKYCYLWTKDFGARVQGWMSYLSGMYGCAFGGQDTWSYTNTYNESDASSDGVDIITSDDKKLATWQDSLQYRSSYQLGYMRDFFENIVGNWYELCPRFDNTSYFTPTNSSVFYVCATKEVNSVATKAVVYFYNFSDTELGKTPNATAANAVKTGTINRLQKNTKYNYVWYNPVTGQIDEQGTLTSSSSGTITIPNKTTTDMVFYLCKADSCSHASTTTVEATTKTCATRAYDEYTICCDCLTVTSGTKPSASSSTGLAAHTSSGTATCTVENKCTVCNTVLQSRLGHNYNSTVTPSGCDTKGKITYVCQRDGCNATYEKELDALGHSDYESTSFTLPSSKTYFWITEYGGGTETPFKGLSFEGDSCVVKFYIFNNTGSTLSLVSLAYNWGYHSYASESDATSKTEISGTKIKCNIPSGTGGYIRLTVPKQAIISNKEGSATDNSTDSIGNLVNYADMGIRFQFAKSTTGTFYVTCVDVTGTNVVNGDSVNQFLAKSGSLMSGNYPVAITSYADLEAKDQVAAANAYCISQYNGVGLNLPSSGDSYLITKSGSSNDTTPFENLEFDGDSCKVNLYVYNDTEAAISEVALTYNWGYNCYASTASTSTRIDGTYSTTTIPSQSGAWVTLTLPKSAIVSNKSGSATAGANDSLGQFVSYKDMGLKFVFASSTTGSIYVSCIGTAAGVEGAQAITESLKNVSSMGGGSTADAIDSIKELRAIDTGVYGPAAWVTYNAAMIEGFLGETSTEYYDAQCCTHCNKVLSKTVSIEISSNVNANASYTVDGVTTDVEISSTAIKETIAGDTLCTLTAEDVQDKTFKGWYKISGSKKVLLSTEKTVDVFVSANSEFYAYYVDQTDENIVTFKDDKGNIIATCSLDELTADDIPEASAFSGTTFNGWVINGKTYTNSADIVSAIKNNNASITVSQSFTKDSSLDISVVGSVDGDYNKTVSCLTVVTVEASSENGSKTFSYWTATDKNGDEYIASYNMKYSFYATNDTTLTAVYGEEVEKALITVTGVTKANSKAVATIQRSVTKDCTVLEQGVLITKDNTVTEDDMILSSDKVLTGTIIKARSTGTANNGVLIVTKLNVAEADNYRFRGYVIYKDSDDTVHTVYSEIK